MAEAQASAADGRVEAARAALRRHEWGEALELLRAADGDDTLTAADFDLLGEAAMWAGHVDECLAAWESAYARHMEDGERVAAARGWHDVAQTPDGFAGRGVHEAARIGELAVAGEILTSAATLAQAPSDVRAESTREVSLKGLDKPLTIAAIDWH